MSVVMTPPNIEPTVDDRADELPRFRGTEVGSIPEDWSVLPLVEISHPKYPICYGIVQIGPDVGNGIPVLAIKNLNTDYQTKVSLCSLDIEVSYARSRVSPGDILVSVKGTTGRIGIVPSHFQGNISRDLARIRLNDQNLPEFWYQMLQGGFAQKELESATVGTTRLELSIGILKQISMPCPPLPQQRAIAKALADVDGLIAAVDKLIAKKRAIKLAAMQQLLTGKTRLPGFDGEWEVKRLGELGEISSAGVDKKVRLGEVPVRLVNYLDVYKKDFICSNDLNHTVSAPLQQAKRCAVQKGDVFFTPSSETRDDIGHSAVAMEDIPDATYSYHVVRLRLHEKWDLKFRAYAFKTKDFFDQAQVLCDGSGTRYVISQGKFKSMTVLVPPTREQSAIATVLSDMDAEIEALERRREKTRVVKQGMMQALLTGRVRLVPPGGAA